MNYKTEVSDLFLKIRMIVTLITVVLVLFLFILWTHYFWNEFEWTLMHKKISSTLWLFLAPTGFSCIGMWLWTAPL